MGFYLKYGNRFVKRTRNRRIEGIDSILGVKKLAKIYSTERDCKKAISMYDHIYKELRGNLVIVPAKGVKKKAANPDELEE